MKTSALILMFTILPLIGCGQAGGSYTEASLPQQTNEGFDEPVPEIGDTDGDTEDDSEDTGMPLAPSPAKQPVDESKIALDSYGESFQAKIASKLIASRYMEKNCSAVNDWEGWEHLPLIHCRYRTAGQNAEVIMLNPGPRRLTLWLQEACGSFAKNFTNCMDKAYKQILYQSGGQFPVAGVVIEDMDGNGKGNAYAFRNGVTIQVSAFATATETLISQTQINRSFTDAPIKTYSYGRPISLTREQLTAYASKVGLKIPALGTSSARTNTFNEVMADLYKSSWMSSQNHIIRAWVSRQNY